MDTTREFDAYRTLHARELRTAKFRLAIWLALAAIGMIVALLVVGDLRAREARAREQARKAEKKLTDSELQLGSARADVQRGYVEKLAIEAALDKHKRREVELSAQLTDMERHSTVTEVEKEAARQQLRTVRKEKSALAGKLEETSLTLKAKEELITAAQQALTTAKSEVASQKQALDDSVLANQVLLDELAEVRKENRRLSQESAQNIAELQQITTAMQQTRDSLARCQQELESVRPIPGGKSVTGAQEDGRPARDNPAIVPLHDGAAPPPPTPAPPTE